MHIKYCQKCSLFNNQEPLLDKANSADVIWIGLSAKKVIDINNEAPLSANTNSGKVIQKIENGLRGYRFSKTNLVKCLPLDDDGKLRYPKVNEMKACYSNLLFEIDIKKPKIVFLLGQNVSTFVLKEMNMMCGSVSADYRYMIWENKGKYYVPIHHPSYMHVYRRKQIDQYVVSVQKLIVSLLSGDERVASVIA